MELQGKRVVVVGTGISGCGAVKLLNAESADVILYDSNEKADEGKIRERLNGENAKIVLGEFTEEMKTQTELLVISPGVPIDSELVLDMKKRNVPVWGEIELAFHFEKGRVIAITGTNGKTTTTALTGQIMRAANPKTFVVGNIGLSYTGEVLKTSEDSNTVAEISSFQLESIENFHPVVSAILNITPDHLNRHHTMECYEQTKERICENQTSDEVVVLNYDDERLRAFGEKTQAKVVWFARVNRPTTGTFAFLDGDTIKYSEDGKVTDLMNVHEMNLIGAHNYENVMAAICIAKAAGVPDSVILEQVRIFKAVEHRIEYVATKNDVMYYNDSKGTNPEAAVKAIEAMSRPTILIGGGYDKGSEYDLYIKAFEGHVKELVLIGQTADKIEACARKYGFTNIVRCDSLKEVVEVCVRDSNPGDAVLLSPACASWGMFDNYEQRGDMFKDYVNAL